MKLFWGQSGSCKCPVSPVGPFYSGVWAWVCKGSARAHSSWCYPFIGLQVYKGLWRGTVSTGFDSVLQDHPCMQ